MDTLNRNRPLYPFGQMKRTSTMSPRPIAMEFKSKLFIAVRWKPSFKRQVVLNSATMGPSISEDSENCMNQGFPVPQSTAIPVHAIQQLKNLIVCCFTLREQTLRRGMSLPMEQIS